MNAGTKEKGVFHDPLSIYSPIFRCIYQSKIEEHGMFWGVFRLVGILSVSQSVWPGKYPQHPIFLSEMTQKRILPTPTLTSFIGSV